ncbi:MAG: hypothetical protein ACUVRK_03720 [Spirochaetota bacterium]
MEVKDTINYYVEPVEIEIYLKKAGKVRTIIKDMFVELIDPEPLDNETSKKIFKYFISRNEPIDIIEITNVFPELISIVFESYYHNINLYEKLSMYFKSGVGGSTDSWRLALYFTELLMKFEPTIASSQYIGDFQTYNLNYCIRKLNALGEKFLLEDRTVMYLIKRRNKAYEGKSKDKEFEKLVELWQFNLKERPF